MRGGLVWASFDPRLGHEQGGRRPALVISNSDYTHRTGLMICLAVTSQAKGYSTEVPLPDGLAVRGVILASHIYTMDWGARTTEAIGVVPQEVLEAALSRLGSIILQ